MALRVHVESDLLLILVEFFRIVRVFDAFFDRGFICCFVDIQELCRRLSRFEHEFVELFSSDLQILLVMVVLPILEMFNSLVEELVLAILKGEGRVPYDDAAELEQTLRFQRTLICPQEGSLLIKVLVEIIFVEIALIRPILVLLGLLWLLLGRLFLFLVLLQTVFEAELNLILLLGAAQRNQNNAGDDGQGEAQSKIS